MNPVIRIHDDSGTRTWQADELPLQIGGRGADIPVSGSDDRVLGRLGIVDGVPFIESDSDAGVRVNGSPCEQSCWLGDGNIVVLPEAHIVCRIRRNEIDLHVRSRSAAQTPPPQAADSHAVIEPVAFNPGHGSAAAGGRALPWLQLGVAVSALLLGIAAWFMFTARSIDIAIAPQPQSLELQGAVFKPRVGGRYLLRPGQYRVAADLEGYKPLRETITVGNASNQQFALQMEKLPGLLTVDTGAVNGARIVVDGQEIGTSPLADAEVAPGLHSLRIIARNHLPFEQEIEISGRGQRQSVEVVLQPNWAPVTIETTPPGATLSSDGVTLGQTPLVAEVEAGEQQLLLQLDGYKPVERTVTVVAGQPLELEAIAFEPADGIVMLTSNPAGASVSVDRQFQGRTPLSVAVTPDASHQVVLSRPGYRTATRSVELAPGEQTELSVRLAPILGSVRIVASPEDAEVLVDGTSRGSANQTLSLTTAPHRIEIHKKGYAPHIETITPREGIEQRVSVILKTIAEAQAAVLDPVITSVEGHTLVLVPTGALQMGSPRREQGRRSNEIRRDVELTREFYISENEVTNAQYREFMDTHNSGFVGGLSLEGDDQPVVRLGWQQAARYCNWLSEREGLPPAYVERDGRLVGRRPMTTGYRMPTEAEWVWVTRFAGGARATKYPWGDTLPPPQGSANLADNAARNLVVQRLDNYDDGFSVTAPVGSFPANALGLRDLDGNVAEWMHDIYEASTADPYLSLVDPVGPRRGNRHVIRGSSWKHGGIVELRGAYRDYGRGGREDVGFRLARYAR